MQPITRRRALQLGGLGLGSAAIGGAGLAWRSAAGPDPSPGAGTGAASGSRPGDAGSGAREPGSPLREPQELRSSDGLLAVTLRAARGQTLIAGRPATTLGYNGGLPGPTLRVRPGDRLQVRLVNDLDEPTNLHVHGLHVSPVAPGDDVFITVEPGESYDYEHRLPDDHPPGVSWYHPHHHGTVADQLFGGLYGAIVVEDPEPPEVTRERLLVVADTTLDGSGRVATPSAMAQMAGREGELVLVNGQSAPALTAAPGERERWRVVNACSSRYLRLRLDGQEVRLVGVDSGRYAEPRAVDEVLLAPGNRADLLVTTAEGSSTLQALPHDRGGMGARGGAGGMGGMAGTGGTDGRRAASTSGDAVDLATLDVAGAAVPALPAVPQQPTQPDLRDAAVTGSRELTFAMGMEGGPGMDGGMRWTIDGKTFDADRVDQSVRLGTVEEWTLTNTSPMDHPVHLHVWPMQVVAEGGRPVEDAVWRDVVDLPAGGQVTVRVSFDRFPGCTVYHCHVLDHEDRGMMGALEAA